METGNQTDTRTRLIEAAGPLFAEKGFHGTSIREICEAAGANVASIHYHFGDKEALYKAVGHSITETALRRYPPERALGRNMSAEASLEAFILLLVMRRHDPERPEWHWKIMRREMHEPSSIVPDMIKPIIERNRVVLQHILEQLLPKGVSEQCLQDFVDSIVGQCLFYRPLKTKHVMEHASGKPMLFSVPELEHMAKHIATFSLAAIKNYPRDLMTYNEENSE